MSLNSQKKIPRECIICASRPALYFNRLNVCPATFYCNHSTPPSRPHLVPSKTYKFLNILCCFVLIIGMINDLLQFGVKLTAKEFFLVCELLISTSTIIVNILCLLRSHTKIQESHGLISLIDKKVVFEVTEVLSASSAGKIYDLLLLFILILALHEVAILFRIVITEELDFVLVVRIFATEIILLCNVSIALYFAQFLTLYDITFENCYEELRKCVQSKAHARLVTKLKKLQRFYMCLRRNFKLNERFVRSGIVITYAINVCLVLIMFSYFVVLQAEQELDLTTLDLYLAGKSMALIGMFFVGCYDAQRILNKVLRNYRFHLNIIILDFRRKIHCCLCFNVRQLN